jgi:hypothetical protein
MHSHGIVSLASGRLRFRVLSGDRGRSARLYAVSRRVVDGNDWTESEDNDNNEPDDQRGRTRMAQSSCSR